MAAPDPDVQAQIQAAVRAELRRIGRRYLPIVTAGVVFALIVTLVPTVEHDKSSSNRTVAASAGEQGAAAPGSAGSAGSAGSGAADTPAAISATGGGAAGGGAPTASGAGDASSDTSAITPPAAPGSAGTARSGVACAPNVRQVVWSVYAPLCIPAFSGSNGGATFHGVTKDTITVSFRRSNSTQDTAVYAAAGAAAPAPDSIFLADMRDYINFFNKNYELYGRKVVLKDFQGQGDYIVEDMGQGQAAAAGDAVAAHDAGAFADVTFPLKGSDPFWNGLAQQKVVALGPLGYPQSYYERNAPYWYTGSPTGTQGAQWTANLACQRLQGMPAIFAGDPLAQRTTRVFGLVTPENPQYIAVANEIEAGMKACGAKLARRATYSINVATFQTQSTSIVAQMKTAGVTTLFCYCDPLVPIFLSRAADEQAYHPEWTEPYYRDPQGRILSQSQWAHAVSAQGLATPRTKSEAYKVFKLANPTAEPREQYFDVAYGTVLILFNALQAAGPALTPAAFERGFHSLPASLSFGDFGGWQYGPKAFSPAFTNTLGYWDPNLKSPYDGKQGGWQNCGEKVVAYTDPATFGTPHTQLHCFGK